MAQRNPYVLLGIPFGSSRDAATSAFARRAKRLRRSPDGAERLTDLTWAMNQIDEVLREPELALNVYRVPADPSALVPTDQGVLRPPPERLRRRTETSQQDHLTVRRRSARELVDHLGRMAARCVAVPTR
jgi:hypothetical protein